MPSCAVDDRRVDEQEELLAARRAALVHQLERLLGEPLGELARVGDRRRRADERRVRAVVPADALQPPQHVREVAAEHAAVGVQLVDDDEAQVLEQLRPRGWCGRMPECSMSGLLSTTCARAADRPARVLRRVAVVGEHADLGAGALVHVLGELVQLGELILRERLGRKQVQRARRRDPAGSRSGPARCSRASCPTPSAWSRRRCGRRARARRRPPGACRAARCRAPRARPAAADRAPPATPRSTASRAGIVADRGDPAVRRVGPFGEAPAREPCQRGRERLLLRGSRRAPNHRRARGLGPRQVVIERELRRHGQR